MLSALFHYARVAYYRLVKPRMWRWRYTSLTRNGGVPSVQIFKSLFPFHKKTFLADFFHSVQPRLFTALDDDNAVQYATALALLRRTEDVLHEARETMHHRFRLLSDVTIDFGAKINWHKDYKSDYDWSHLADTPSHEIDFLTTHDGSDVKYPWEVNRFQWLAWLGQGFLAGNEAEQQECTKHFEREIVSWIAANPVGRGINWAMPMEVAIRAANWILGYGFFYARKNTLSEKFWLEFLRMLYAHGVFLEHNLEYVRHPGNHFDSNALGLVVLGSFFHDSRAGKRWFSKGKQFLEREMQRQVYADGVNYEKSTAYHRLVAEIFTVAALVAKRTGSPFSAQYLSRLEAMYEYMAAYTRLDGTVPRVGDADNGRIFRFYADEDFNNHTYNLALGALLFKRPDFAAKASFTPADILFCWSVNADHEFAELRWQAASGLPLTHFERGGYVVMEHAGLHLFVDVGDYGMDGWGGHGHNDCLSFELFLGEEHSLGAIGGTSAGAIFITDSGTGVYTADKALRNRLRGTSAHNTVVLCDSANKQENERENDNEAEQVGYQGLWRIQKDELSPHLLSINHATDAGVTRFSLCAEHSGYVSRFGVKHRRTVDAEVHEFGGKIMISDELLESVQISRRRLDSQPCRSLHFQGFAHYHIPWGISVELIDPYSVVLRTAPTDATTTIVECSFTSSEELMLEECVISRFYGQTERALRIKTPVNTATATIVTLQYLVRQQAQS